MIGRSDDIQIGVEGALVGFFECLHVLDGERDVLRPHRRIRVAAHGGRIRQLEERENAAVSSIEENMHVGIGGLGGGDAVLRDSAEQIHIQHLLVEFDCRFGVHAPIGDVMEFLDVHDESP